MDAHPGVPTRPQPRAPPPHPRHGLRPIHLIYILFLGLPVGLWADLTGRSTFAFIASAFSLIPAAYLIGLATDSIALRLGPGLGSIVLATMGNAVEIIIGLLGLQKGLVRVVQAAITGSIISNILLVLGSAMLAGGFRYRTQRFGGKAANVQATVLFLAVLALFLPTLAEGILPKQVDIDRMSLLLAGGLLITYVLGLFFTLRTHKHLFEVAEEGLEPAVPRWKTSTALWILGGVTLAATAAAEILTRSVEAAAQTLGWTDLFVGAIVLAIISNASEHSAALVLAWKNRMNEALQITTASSIQIALFAAPLLIFASQWFVTPLTLAFPPFEMLAIGAGVLVLNFVTYDGESNWFEGALLVMVYLIIGIAFYLIP